MFDNISGDYDKLNHIMSLDIDKSWRRRAIRRIVDRDEPVDVLDIACGTGDFSIAIAKALQNKRMPDCYCKACRPPVIAADESVSVFARPSGRGNLPERKLSSGTVTAVDISEGMLDVMRKKVASEHLGDIISIENGDGENLRFPDSSFDRVTIAFGIRNFENKEKGLKEMLRVLRKGGRLVILELSLPENKLVRDIFNLYFLHILPLLGGSVSGDSSAYKYLPASVVGFPKKKEFMSLMTACGFRNVIHKSFTFGICRMYIGER